MNNYYTQREINRIASQDVQVNYGAEFFKFALLVVIIGLFVILAWAYGA